MSEWRNEIKATMNAIVYNIPSIQTTFVPQKSFVLLINVLQYCTETIRIVNGITESGCINYSQS